MRSTHSGYVGIKGTIIDETRDTIVIRRGDERKVVPKAVVALLVTLPSGTKVEIDGGRLLGRPWDRIKNVPRRQW